MLATIDLAYCKWYTEFSGIFLTEMFSYGGSITKHSVSVLTVLEYSYYTCMEYSVTDSRLQVCLDLTTLLICPQTCPSHESTSVTLTMLSHAVPGMD